MLIGTRDAKEMTDNSNKYSFNEVTVNWRDDANCLDDDPELFFPESEQDTEQIENAKRKCGACAVIVSCFVDAVDNSINHGIRGGLTEGERKIAKRLSRRGNKLDRYLDEVLPPGVY